MVDNGNQDQIIDVIAPFGPLQVAEHAQYIFEWIDNLVLQLHLTGKHG